MSDFDESKPDIQPLENPQLEDLNKTIEAIKNQMVEAGVATIEKVHQCPICHISMEYEGGIFYWCYDCGTIEKHTTKHERYYKYPFMIKERIRKGGKESSKEPMTKTEFLQTWVLNRSAINTEFNPSTSLNNAEKVWDEIKLRGEKADGN